MTRFLQVAAVDDLIDIDVEDLPADKWDAARCQALQAEKEILVGLVVRLWDRWAAARGKAAKARIKNEVDAARRKLNAVCRAIATHCNGKPPVAVSPEVEAGNRCGEIKSVIEALVAQLNLLLARKPQIDDYELDVEGRDQYEAALKAWEVAVSRLVQAINRWRSIWGKECGNTEPVPLPELPEVFPNGEETELV